MAKKKTAQSVEPQVADRVNGWLKDYGLTYYLEQDSLNPEIDNALRRAPSKRGGEGGNRVDCKLLLQDEHLRHIPVMIEYKGYADKLVKLNADGYVHNFEKGAPSKHINDYAVNGAVHYANAILQHSTYKEVVAIGVTGHKDEQGELHTSIGVYYVNHKNYGLGQLVGEYPDLSFLSPPHFSSFVTLLDQLNLSDEEREHMQQNREQGIEDALARINEWIFSRAKNIGEAARVYLVSACIMANLGVAGKVKPLELEDLHSGTEKDATDGDIMMRKIKAFLAEKNIPAKKQEQILDMLRVQIADERLSEPQNGCSILKEIFQEVITDLGHFYKVGLDTDFTGKLFNVMFRWMNFAKDKENDVVLTPRYVAYLLVHLARVNSDSYVWDFAMGSGGLLVAAMNVMLQDAKEKYRSPKELREKEEHIKAQQILGIEVLPEIYMLAILNMILMGDGSSNVLNGNSLTAFDGSYSYGGEGKFPATAFVLNPPYSEEGNGMNFVERALSMMSGGHAAIIIQDSAGSGKAQIINQRILKKHTLVASIKMPVDIFIGKSSVQTSIYVFRVGEAHEAEQRVRFIDFRNDGYKRASRKKAKASSNLRDIDHAKERYEEVVRLVKFGESQRDYLDADCFIEDTIALSGSDYGKDWNFDQHKRIDTRPTLTDFKRTVADYLAWEVSRILKEQGVDTSKKA